MHHLGALSRGDHRHHQDHTHAADSIISTSTMRRACLEIMMREAHDILGGEHATLHRSDAREILSVGDGYHYDKLCIAACKKISECLDFGITMATVATATMIFAAIQTLLPSGCYTNFSQKWSFKNHRDSSAESRGTAITVVLCAKRSQRVGLGRLPKEMLEMIIAMALDDGWSVPPRQVTASLRGAGITRGMLCHSDAHPVMARLCAIPINIQLTVWSAMERALKAEEKKATSDQGYTVDPFKGNSSSGALDISRYCYPTGVPRGCKLVCSDFCTSSDSHIIITLDLVPLSDATHQGEAAIEEALAQPNPIGTGTIEEGTGPRIYWSRGTQTLRVVVLKSHNQHDAGAWDIEIFSPGCIEPIHRLTHDKWPSYFHDKLVILSDHVMESSCEIYKQLRHTWNIDAENRIQRRANKCRERSHTVYIITAKAALHQWGSSSKVLVKGEPPLVPIPIIGVVA